MSTLHIQLLGEFRLSNGTEHLLTIDQPRQRALLAYLLLHCQAPQPRRQIAFLFWPDTSEAQAHTNLRQLLHHLRRIWPAVGDFVQINTHTLQWKATTTYELDIAQFKQALARAAEATRLGQLRAARIAFAEAIEQYAGDLLPGAYDEWLLAERERLRQWLLHAVEQLILLCEEQRDYPTAIHYAQRLLRADSLHETTYRRLMRLYALNNDRASALRTYHICTTILARELGVEPTQDTHDAYTRLLNLELPPKLHPPSAIQPTDRLVGRQPAWAKLQTAWQSAMRGRAQFVCISGEAGIGKTRLAEEFLTWARHQGIAQARTQSYAAEGSLAYAPVAEWLRAEVFQPARKQLADLWLSEVARLLPELLTERPTLPHPEPLTEHWQRQRFFEALARTMMSASQPLLLVIDDLQWCDAETLAWLPYLLRFDPNARLLILGTLRPEEVDAQHPLDGLLLHLHNADQLTEIKLDPLTAEETSALASQLAAQPIDPAAAQRLYQETEGNPLFIVETMRSESVDGAARDGAIRTTQAVDAQPVRRSALPPKVYVVIRRRLVQLSPVACDLVGLAAIIGRSFTFDLLTQAGDITEDALVAGLDELWQRGIVRVQGANTYDFSHDRIREVAYNEISPVRRPLLHRRVAQALETLYHDTLDTVCGQLAFHYEQAGLMQQAITYYRRAATIAHHLLAYTEMETHLNKSLALLDALPATPVHLAQKLDILSLMGGIFLISKGFTAPEVEDVLTKARALCSAVIDSEIRFAVLCGLRVYWGKRCRWAIAAELNEELLHLAQETQNSVHLQAAQRYQGALAFHQGKLCDAYTYFEQAIALHEANQRLSDTHDHERDQGISNLRYSLGTLWLLGYPEQAHRRMQEMLERTRKVARPFDMLISIDFALDLEHRLRRPQAVRALVAEYSALTVKHPYPYCIAYELTFRGWVLAEQGKTTEGIALLNQGIDMLRKMNVFLFWPQVLTLLIHAYGLAKQYAQGVALANETLAFVAETGEQYWNAEFHRLKGELLLAQGASVTEIEPCFQQALTIARHQAAKSLELRAAMSLAQLWQTQGRQAEARTLLAEIYGWFTEGFDTADLQEAKALLTQLGQDR